MPDAIEEQFRRELSLLCPVIAKRLGLSMALSRWNPEHPDNVDLLPGESIHDEGNSGIFRLTGVIGIKVGLADSSHRWHTMIHELLHAFSAGSSQDDYSDARGWEEGVVEHLQRLICRDVLHEIDIEPDESVIAEREANWPFNAYLTPWEAIRMAIGTEDAVAFYRELLAVKISARHAYLYHKALSQKNVAAVKVIAACKPILNSDFARWR